MVSSFHVPSICPLACRAGEMEKQPTLCTSCRSRNYTFLTKILLEGIEIVFKLHLEFLCSYCFTFVFWKEIRFVCNWPSPCDHTTLFLQQKIQCQRKWSATSVIKHTQMRNAGTLTAAHTATACRVRLSVPPSAAHPSLVLNPSTWKEAAVLCVQVMWCDNPDYCSAPFLGLIRVFFNWFLSISPCLNSIKKTTDI